MAVAVTKIDGDGGDDDDTLELADALGGVALGGEGTDTLTLVGATNIVTIDSIETVTGSDGDDALTVTTNDLQSVFGGDGFDEVVLTDGSGNTVDLAGVENVSYTHLTLPTTHYKYI